MSTLITFKDVENLTAAYFALREIGSPIKAQDSEFARGQAMGYLWGRMDAGDRFDSILGDAFPWAYATMVTLAESGRKEFGFSLSVRDAWESFGKYGQIRDYSGRAIDRLPVSE